MSDELQHVDLTAFPRLRPNEYLSPFRYPGGKTFLTGYLANMIASLPAEKTTTYVEPYCGGAGAAFSLLSQNRVGEIYLNDADIRIYSAWKAIVDENERFLHALKNTKVTIDTWCKCRNILTECSNEYSFELGFATYFVNRTSRAGIVLGSGPIGGYEQSGEWKLDARYYKETMERRISWIGAQSEKIKLSNLDGLNFLKSCISSLDDSTTLYFIDPPYVQAGSRLYLNAMTKDLHEELAVFLKSGACKNWVLTYDNDPLIRELYSDRDISYLSVNYSLRNTRKENELLVR